MAYDAILSTEIEVGDPVTNDLMTKIKTNFEFFNGLIGQFNTLDIVNGSFEEDTDADDVPDNWTWTAHPGGSKNIVAGIEGANAFEITAPSGASNGGGTLDSEFIPIVEYTAGGPRTLSWMMKSTAATIGIKVTIRAYTGAQAFISEYDLFSATANHPSSWTRYYAVMGASSLPATTRFIKVRIEGGTVGPGVPGVVTFDAMSVNLPPPPTWRENSNWTSSPVTTTNNTFTNLTTTGIACPGSSRIGGECKIVASGYMLVKSADQNIQGFGRVAEGSTTSNEMQTHKLGPSDTNATEQEWHWTLIIDLDYSQTYALDLQAKNDDNTTTITLTQPAQNDITLSVSYENP